MPFYSMPDQEKLYVREIGQGQPVVILSGLGMSSWQWLPFIAPHLKKYRFYIPDYRGFGKSKKCKIPSNPNAIDSHWQDLKALLPQLNLDSFKLIGYSMGATTTMHALKFGDLERSIDQYLHIDQTPKIRNDKDWLFGLYGTQQAQFFDILARLHALLLKYKDYGTLANLPLEIKAQFSKLWIELGQIQGQQKYLNYLGDSKIFQQIQPTLLPMQKIDYLLWYLGTYLNHDEDYREALTTLNKPTHFIIGEQSILYPSEGQKLIASKLNQSTSYVLKRSGHVPLMTQPLAFAQAISKFLSA